MDLDGKNGDGSKAMDVDGDSADVSMAGSAGKGDGSKAKDGKKKGKGPAKEKAPPKERGIPVEDKYRQAVSALGMSSCFSLPPFPAFLPLTCFFCYASSRYL
jgi:hypothetical protein